MPRTTKDIKKDKLKKTKKSANLTTNNKENKSSELKSTKKVTNSSTKKKTNSKIKKVDNAVIGEYYDLPYRYNETMVKILYQTPNILFVYWDISDDDRNKFINEYGENFFNTTKPILKIFNLTKNYDFEIEINDFANSWYINVSEPNCDYKVELTRKKIQLDNNSNSDYVYVATSNDLEFPNDHILLENLPNEVNFRNIKTNEILNKDIGTLHLIGINKTRSIYDFYKELYRDELLDHSNKKIINTSSSS